MRIKNLFHINSFALSLAWKQKLENGQLNLILCFKCITKEADG